VGPGKLKSVVDFICTGALLVYVFKKGLENKQAQVATLSFNSVDMV